MTPGTYTGINGAGFVNFGRQFKPGNFARHAIFPPRRMSALASSHGDGLITGRFTFLQIQAMNAHQIEAIVQFVEKKTDVLVNLPTGFEKSLTKCLVCV